MQRMLTVAATLLLAGSVAAAQSSRTNQEPARGPSHARSVSAQRGAIDQAVDEKQTSDVVGCLRLVNQTYWLNDSQGDAYRLTGRVGPLARYVGKKVRLSGTKGAHTSNKSNQNFRVSSAEEIGTMCPDISAYGPRIQATPWQGTQGGVAGTAKQWKKGNSHIPPPGTNDASGGTTGAATVAAQAADAYERHPQKTATGRSLPNPPLPQPRPEDETPSAGTAVGNRSGAHASAAGAAQATGTSKRNGTNHRKNRKNTSRHHHQNENPSASGTSTPHIF